MRHGVLLVDKPLHWTSHDCVAKVRSILGERSIGHLGTLDPLAQGLLVLFVGGKALKVIECFEGLQKSYAAEITLGKVSSTYDGEGAITESRIREVVGPKSREELQILLSKRFVGEALQTPPAYSAAKVGGVRAYKLAREGVHPASSIRTTPRQVHVRSLSILDYSFPKLLLCLDVSSGFYVRTLAHEIGELLRCGGYLSSLVRTKVGPWSVSQAVSPVAASWSEVIPLREMLPLPEASPLPPRDPQPRGEASSPPRGIEVTDEEAEHLRHGRSIERRIPSTVFAWHSGNPIALLIRDPKVPGRARPRKVL